MCSAQYPLYTQYFDFPEVWLLALFKGVEGWILKNFAVIRWITAYAVELASDDDDGYFCKNMQASEM